MMIKDILTTEMGSKQFWLGVRVTLYLALLIVVVSLLIGDSGKSPFSKNDMDYFERGGVATSLRLALRAIEESQRDFGVGTRLTKEQMLAIDDYFSQFCDFHTAVLEKEGWRLVFKARDSKHSLVELKPNGEIWVHYRERAYEVKSQKEDGELAVPTEPH